MWLMMMIVYECILLKTWVYARVEIITNYSALLMDDRTKMDLILWTLDFHLLMQ